MTMISAEMSQKIQPPFAVKESELRMFHSRIKRCLYIFSHTGETLIWCLWLFILCMLVHYKNVLTFFCFFTSNIEITIQQLFL